MMIDISSMSADRATLFNRFGQAGAASFPFFSGQVIDKAGAASIMPYTFGLAIVMLIYHGFLLLLPKQLLRSFTDLNSIK
jgi:hypothetical protein